MKIYNTLTHSLEDFKPINSGEVTVYTCGPTVYNFMHIGNLRTFVFSDLLQRALKFNNYKVKSAQNITDIDDKIIKKAAEKSTTIEAIGEEYSNYFLEDVKKLNIEEPTFRPKATQYIEEMVAYIKILLEKGVAYKEEDGSVYFDISKFDNYGKLSRVSNRELKSGTRNLSDEYTKDNVQDFALWKAESEESLGAFESELGWGRPGWHIECSVMCQSLLGNKIDIHAGGIDLIFPHHENEIAQSEVKSGEKPFVAYWVHGAHMFVNGEKMSKSLNNFYTISDIENKGFEPIVLRYLYLQTHYRQEMNFTWEALEAAQTALDKLRKKYLNMNDGKINIPGEFVEAINDDLNFPKALSVVWENLDSMNKSSFDRLDEVLGLNLLNYKEKEVEIPEEINELSRKREELRKVGNYEEADKIRDEIEAKGYSLQDSSNGVIFRKKT